MVEKEREVEIKEIDQEIEDIKKCLEEELQLIN